ncbi:MAG: heavy metal translocating P-type ATPase, partial [Lachnospiraceae bacterium]|nr:heavy metal translocating P-type ATPase [Lachnospiraceae bacterium]
MTKKQKKMLKRIIIASVLFIVLNIINKVFASGGLKSQLWYKITLISFYAAAYLVIGYDILKKAFKGIIKGQVFDENFLMAVATLGAIGVTVYNTVALGSTDFDFNEAVAVMLFYQIGEFFQSVAVGKSRKSITALMDIRPDYANIEKDGQLTQVDPEEVAVGSVIVVQPGERVPLDGFILEGSSTLNTSALTGESLPREVSADDEVISGCINMTGVLKVQTTKAFGESTVSKILT